MSDYTPVVKRIMQRRERERLMKIQQRPARSLVYHSLDFLVWDRVSSVIVNAIRRRIKNRE